ncbi:MAG: type I toxin-antitoxin system SymE family toxin [Clostridiales bacterium]|nr:type I toxin-antitoxin system SymE family toxin [Clostridiales bacterium]
MGKNSRLLTIGEVPAGYGRKATPQLRIQGLWMQALGFKIEDTVRVRCEDGILVITQADRKRR